MTVFFSYPSIYRIDAFIKFLRRVLPDTLTIKYIGAHEDVDKYILEVTTEIPTDLIKFGASSNQFFNLQNNDRSTNC